MGLKLYGMIAVEGLRTRHVHEVQCLGSALLCHGLQAAHL